MTMPIPSSRPQMADILWQGILILSGQGTDDIWVLKLNADGTVAWQKTYGGTGDDDAIPSSRPQMADILWQDIPLLSGQELAISGY